MINFKHRKMNKKMERADYLKLLYFMEVAVEGIDNAELDGVEVVTTEEKELKDNLIRDMQLVSDILNYTDGGRR